MGVYTFGESFHFRGWGRGGGGRRRGGASTFGGCYFRGLATSKLCATGVSVQVYLQYVDRQIKAAELDVEDLHDYSAIDLQAASPFVIISVGHIGILLANVE